MYILLIITIPGNSRNIAEGTCKPPRTHMQIYIVLVRDDFIGYYMWLNKRVSPPLSSSGLIIERIRRVVLLMKCYWLTALGMHLLSVDYQWTLRSYSKAAFTPLNSNPKPSYTIWWTLSVLKTRVPQLYRSSIKNTDRRRRPGSSSLEASLALESAGDSESYDAGI